MVTSRFFLLILYSLFSLFSFFFHLLPEFCFYEHLYFPLFFIIPIFFFYQKFLIGAVDSKRAERCRDDDRKHSNRQNPISTRQTAPSASPTRKMSDSEANIIFPPQK